MPVQAFQLLSDVESPPNDRIAVPCGLQSRLVGNSMSQGDRIGRVLRNQLAKLVHLAVRHFKHAADVAQHAACLQRSKRDDLGPLIGAVTVLHVADPLVPPVLAEVDVEIRHRYSLRVEKALEYQTESDGIE